MRNGCGNKFLVIKSQDIDKYLTENQSLQLLSIIQQIMNGRKKDGRRPVNQYYVCNLDEPYAKAVEATIIKGEQLKCSGAIVPRQ